MEDEKNNATRFFVVSKSDSPKTGRDKTSILLHAFKDRAGLLKDLLGEFADRGLNLCAIESRPSRKKLGEYDFYLEVSAHRTDEPLRQAVAALKEKKIALVEEYGSYPAAANA